MNEELFLSAIYISSFILLFIVFGIGSVAAGRGFWWGFWFGPAGIIVAAILADGDKTRRAIQMAGTTSSLSGNIKIRKSRRDLTANCQHCHVEVTDIPGPGTYECPNCGQNMLVK